MPARPARLPLLSILAAIAFAACGGVGASPSGAPSASATAPSVDASGATSPSTAGSPSASAAAADITVSAMEYRFEGMPATVESGTVLGLRNDGRELHEMAIYRRNDDVTQSFEDILALPPDEGITLVTEAGVVFAAPGEVAADTVTVSEPGDYVMLCFVPVGMTELPSQDPNVSPGGTPPADGPPHFTQGMIHTFTVGS